MYIVIMLINERQSKACQSYVSFCTVHLYLIVPYTLSLKLIHWTSIETITEEMKKMSLHLKNQIRLFSKYCIDLLIPMYTCDDFEMDPRNRNNHNGQTDGRMNTKTDRQSVAPDKVHSLGKHSLTNKGISRNECVACESHIISENMERQKYTHYKRSMLKLW